MGIFFIAAWLTVNSILLLVLLLLWLRGLARSTRNEALRE